MNISIEDFKISLRGLPKEFKLNSIQQAINNLKLAGSHRPLQGMSASEIEHYKKNPPPPMSDEERKRIEIRKQQEKQKEEKERAKQDNELKELEDLLNEVQLNVEAYGSTTKRKELVPFMCDRSLNWFFNSKNIPAQEKLVMPTYEYFNEGPGKDIFDPLDFLNLLWKQHDDLLSNLEKPFDVLQNLRVIPLNKKERHILFGFILKWFGGYPVKNLDKQLNVVLRLIEKEFLKYPEHTPEKEFCSSNLSTQKEFGELAAHLNAATGMKVITPNDNYQTMSDQFPTSHYAHKVPFDFENLPHYVIERGIIWRFENSHLYNDKEYIEWEHKLAEFLNSIPNEYRIKALKKGIEYGKAVYQFHKDNECTNLSNCALNQSWERRIALAENLLQKAFPKPDSAEPEREIDNEKNKEYTTARQVLAVHYMLEFLQVRNIDATEKARFIQFLTGRESGAKAIQNTNIYKKIKSPLSTNEKTLLEDLQFVRTYFEKLGLSEIAKAITNEISSREKI